MEGSMLPDTWLWPAIAAIVFISLFALRVRRAIQRERSARVAAERSAAQSHRLAQSTAALGHARTSADAMATAIHEPLHWLRGAAGVFFLLSEDRRTLTPALVVAYSLDERDSWDLADWGEGSPFSESLRRLTP